MSSLLVLAVFLPIIAGGFLWNITHSVTLWRTAIAVTSLTLLSTATLMVAGVEAIRLRLFSGFGIGLEGTSFSLLYGFVTALLWLFSVITSAEYFHDQRHLSRYYSALLVTLGGTLGVFFAADLFTLFVFFEVMSFASCLWVAHDQNEQSSLASGSYLAFSVFGGLSMLFGLFLLYGLCPDLQLATLAQNFAPFSSHPQLIAGCLFLFLGFGIKAGTFFLYDWLPLSYTAAPAPASGLLSSLLSKTGIYGILLILWRIAQGVPTLALFLLILALLNMLVGGFFALFSSDLKGTLAYSSISQIGFVLFGIAITALLGEDGAIAAYGTLFHMLNHTFIKFLLFSIAGVVFQSTKTTDLNQLRGWGKEKPLFHLLFVIGGGSMAGIPLLSGYISKTLLHESVVEYIHLANASLLFSVAEYLFLLAGGCTLAYMLKLYLCLFWDGTSPSSTPHCATTKTKVVLSLVALALVVLGTVPHLTFDLIGATNASFMGVEPLHTVAYFSLTNLLGAATSLIIGLFLFWCVRSRALHLNSPHYSGRTDRLPTLYHLLYRPLATALSFSAAIVARIFDLSTDVAVTIISRTLFTPLSIPDAFYEGDPTYGRHQRTRIHITYSLAYSLLMFGVGFLFTLAMLLYLVLSR